MVPFALLLGVQGPLRAGAGTGRVTSGNCCSPPRSPPRCCRYFYRGCWKIKYRRGGGDGDGLLNYYGAGGGRSRTARVSGTKPLSATGEWRRTSGLAVTITGIAFSQNYSVERDVRMRAGDSVTIHDRLHLPGGAGHHRPQLTAAKFGPVGVTRTASQAVRTRRKRLYNTSSRMW